MAESFTNQSREQAESKSSFFKREKILGAFRARRSKITGAKFKKGTSQESSDNIGKRVAANERKITLLKNIIKLRKQNVDKNIKGGDTEKEKVNSPLLASLQAIASTVDSIRDTLIQQQDNDKAAAEDLRRDEEEDKRKKQEKGLETAKPTILQKMGDKVIAPVMSLWQRIWKFISTLFLGKILMNFLDWFGNPANQGKIQTLVRFVKDWWPALVGAVLLFGTGFGGLVAGLIKTIMWFIPAMGAAITKLRAAKFMSMIPGGGKVGAVVKTVAPLAIAGGIGYGMGKMQGGDEPLQMNKGGTVPGSGNKDTVPAMLTPGEFVMSKGAVEQYGVGTLEGMNAAAGGTNIPTLKKVKVPHYRGGGFANAMNTMKTERTEWSHDKEGNETSSWSAGVSYMNPEEAKAFLAERGVPSMELMDGTVFPNFGEVVEPEVLPALQATKEVFINQQFPPVVIAEIDRLIADPHMQPGVITNIINQMIPGSEAQVAGDLGDEITASAKMAGGGLVQGSQGLTQEEVAAMEASKDYLVREGVYTPEEVSGVQPTQKLFGGGLVQGFIGGGLVNDLGVGANRRSTTTSTTPTTPSVNQNTKPQGLMRNIAGYADWATMGMWDFDQRNPKGSPTGFGPKRVWGGLADAATLGITDFDKRGASPLQFHGDIGNKWYINHPSQKHQSLFGGRNTDKWDIGPKQKPKNTIVAYEQEVKNDNQNEQPAGEGNEIPSFTVRPDFMISESKIDVLGIVV